MQEYTDAKEAKGFAHMYDVNTLFVKPWTAGTGCGVAVLMNGDEGLDASLMFSHAWGEDVEECLNSVLRFSESRKVPDTVACWFCVFAQYQPEDGAGPTISEQIQLDPFSTVITSVNVRQGCGMCAIHTTRGDLYDRLWCVMEIDAAMYEGVNVDAALSEAYVKASTHRYGMCREAGGSRRDAELAAGLAVHTARAKCRLEDEPMLFAKVLSRGGGFSRIDDKIKEFRKEKVLGEINFDTNAAQVKEALAAKLAKPPQYDATKLYYETGVFRTIVMSSSCQVAVLTVIALNVVWLSVDMDHGLVDKHGWLQALDYFCFGFLVLWTSAQFMAFKHKSDAVRDPQVSVHLVLVLVEFIWIMVAVFGEVSSVRDASMLRLLWALESTRSVIQLGKERVGWLERFIGVFRSAVAIVGLIVILMVVASFFMAILLRRLTEGTIVGQNYFKSVPLSMNTLVVHGFLTDQVSDVVLQLSDEQTIQHTIGIVLFYSFLLSAGLMLMSMLIGQVTAVLSTVEHAWSEKHSEEMMRSNLFKSITQLNTDGGSNDIDITSCVNLMKNPEFLELLQELGVNPIDLVDSMEQLFKHTSPQGEVESRLYTPAQFGDILLRLRVDQPATFSDIVDLKQYINAKFLYLEDIKRAGLDMNGPTTKTGANDPAANFGFGDPEELKHKVRELVSVKRAGEACDCFWEQGRCQLMARSPYFDYARKLLVTLDLLWIAIDLDWKLLESEPTLQAIDWIFLALLLGFFLVEFMALRSKRVILRFQAFILSALLLPAEFAWMIYSAAAPDMDSLRSATLLRIVWFWVVTRVHETMLPLYIVVKAVQTAFISVVHIFVLLGLSCFFFAIVLMKLTDGLEVGHMYFRTVIRSMSSLFCHGFLTDNVAEVSVAMYDESPVAAAVFFGFLVVGGLVFINMIFGTVVSVCQAVVETSNEDSKIMQLSKELKEVFLCVDCDYDGKVSYMEFEKMMQVKETVRILTDMGVNAVNLVDSVQNILFEDGMAISMTFDEFLEKILQLRELETAKKQDIMAVQTTIRESFEDASSNFRKAIEAYERAAKGVETLAI